MISNWKQSIIDLGIIKESTKHILEYEITGPHKEIETINPGCAQCTTIKGFKDGKLTAKFKAGSVPVHMRQNPGYQSIRKIITVVYKDGSKDILSFTAKVIK